MRIDGAGHAHVTLKSGGRRAAFEKAGVQWVSSVLGNLKR